VGWIINDHQARIEVEVFPEPVTSAEVAHLVDELRPYFFRDDVTSIEVRGLENQLLPLPGDLAHVLEEWAGDFRKILEFTFRADPPAAL
jgi:hypothetical protein